MGRVFFIFFAGLTTLIVLALLVDGYRYLAAGVCALWLYAWALDVERRNKSRRIPLT